MSARHDRGLHAVARVREVRERDSLLGLRRATAEHRALEARAQELDDVVRTHTLGLGAQHAADTSAWAAQRATLAAVAAAARTAWREVATAETVRTAAQEHWQRDHTRLRAVQSLLERRAAVRRDLAVRLEARELDDLGGQRWLRDRRAAEVGG